MQGVRQTYPFIRPAELDSPGRKRFPVIIVGAGPIGMAMGLDLDQRGIENVILDDDNKVSVGSRAICWAKRALEVADRLGCGERMLEKGVTWNNGKVFFGDSPEPVYGFNVLEETDQQFPGFINLQQYYAEEFLIDVIDEREHTAIRWQSEVTAVEQTGDAVIVSVHTQDGDYELECDYLVAADGSNSRLRSMLDLEFVGETFEDNFLIADIRMKADFPTERWFWFDPPFNRGHSALLHKQPDDVWRLDFQLGRDIDREEESKPENVARRIRAMMGEDFEFDFEWVSIYRFSCRRMTRLVHGRVLFAGDAAHIVVPFGARGANSGLQDVDNLGWKLALVLQEKAPAALLESYNDERIDAARENLHISAGTTNFITPKTPASRVFRDATLELASRYPFARRFVNSGRLSTPTILRNSALNTADSGRFDSHMVPGSPSLDAPVTVNGRRTWFLKLLGDGFVGVYFSGDGDGPPAGSEALETDAIPVRTLTVVSGGAAESNQLLDHSGLLRKKLDGRAGTYYLFRPDQHLVARWREFDPEAVREALARATMQAA